MLNPHFPSKYQGMTLIELSAVLVVLIGLAGLVLPYIVGYSSRSACIATETSMVAIRNAIVGSFENPGYFQDMGRLPSPEDDHTNYDLDWLFNQGIGSEKQPDFNPITKKGWRGPYLLSTQVEDAYLTDSKITLQVPSDNNLNNNDCDDLSYDDDLQCARLISDGPNGDTNTEDTEADGSTRLDDRILYLFIPDPNVNPSTACVDT